MKKEELCEIFGDINESYIKEARTPPKRKQSALLKRGAVAACLCLVVVGAGVILGLQDGPGKTGRLVVNQVEATVNADIDAKNSYYNDLSSAEWETIRKEFENAMGLSYDDFTARIPDAFIIESFYSVDVPTDTTRTEYAPHDYVFEYRTENFGEATIAICSVDQPLRDCFGISDNPKQSKINGVKLVIYGYSDTFWVQFSHENRNYDIESRNITLDKLEDLLTGIIG